MKTFVEIGSCDFNTLTHLSQYGWRGVIVEPIKKYFDNIPHEDNICYVNVAVGDTDGITTMWIAPDELVDEDSDFKGMSTVIEGGNPLLTTEVNVPMMTFDTLFEMTEVSSIDFLKIDVEGYDGELLKMFPWHNIKPKFIQFESKHINDLDYVIELLTSMGYHCMVESENTFAILL